MLQQEARLTQEVIDSVVDVEQAAGYFAGNVAQDGEYREFVAHITALPDVLRANLYSRERRVIWSSDPALIGRHFADNDELEDALAGKVVAHGGERAKTEHEALDTRYRYFFEIYTPVRASASGEVVGVVELYKTPQALFEAIAAGERAIWVGAALGGLFLYATLFWLVRRADRTIRAQRERLVQSETFAAIGEMSSAVAHGIRNPLASIRSSAELALDSPPADWRDSARDIVEQVDRLESWIRRLLSYSQPLGDQAEPVQVGALVQASLAGFERELERRHIRATRGHRRTAAAGQGGRPDAGARVHQPDRQRDGGDRARRQHRRRGAARRRARPARERARQRPGHDLEGSAGRLQAVPHQQAERHRHRPAARPAHRAALRRCPSRSRVPRAPAPRSTCCCRQLKEAALPCAVLVVEDEATLARNIKTYLQRNGYDAETAGSAEEGLAAFDRFKPDAVVLDLRLPGMDGLAALARLRASDPSLIVIMLTGHGSVETAVEAMKAGAYDFLTKPVSLSKLTLLLEKALGEARREETLHYHERRQAAHAGLENLLGESEPMRALKSRLAQVIDAEMRLTDTDAPAVLVTGETGVGKELVARALHYSRPARRQARSWRSTAPRSRRSSLESELFGHERGAFTGARERKLGLFEAATGGTLFLDEIGDMALGLQAKLLRCSRSKSVRRVGEPARPARSTCASSPRPTGARDAGAGAALPRRPVLPPERGRRSRCRRCASAARTSCCSRAHFLAVHGARYGKPRSALSAATERALARALPGRATCASCATSSSRRCCSPRGRRSSSSPRACRR